MATAKAFVPDDFVRQLEMLAGNTEDIVKCMLVAAAVPVEAIMRDNLRRSIGNTKFASRSAGELLGSLGTSPVSDDPNDRNIKVGFHRLRRNQGKSVPVRIVQGRSRMKVALGRSYNEITNTMIANVLEYGKHGQPARPFIRQTERATRRQVQDVMREVYDREAGKHVDIE